MKIAIHQPEFMPWPGFFYKMALADLYVVFDHVQFKKRYFDNRNLIVSPKKKVSYIAAPVITKGRFTQSIKDAKIDNTRNWKEVLLKKIKHFYSKAPYFKKYFEKLSFVIGGKEHSRLIDFNMDIINFFRENLGISTPIVFSSQMNLQKHKGSDLILQICLLSSADSYLCGASGKNYLNENAFSKNGVRIEWLGYNSPEYRQLGEGFIANMSTLDLLFNHGDNSLNIIMSVPLRKGEPNPCTY